jgi:hypothetical protein
MIQTQNNMMNMLQQQMAQAQAWHNRLKHMLSPCNTIDNRRVHL